MKIPFLQTKLFRYLLILTIAIPITWWLLHTQRHIETKKYNADSIHKVTDAEKELIYQLSLEYKRLKNFPAEIYQYPNLKVLNVGFNKLDSIPYSIRLIPNLEELYLSGGMNSARYWAAKELKGDSIDSSRIYNSFRSLPNSIGTLTALRILEAKNNRLEEIPASIGQLVLLEELNLQGNLIRRIPPTIGQLTNLKEFKVSINNLLRFPIEICKLVNLERLEAFDNQLIAVPYDIRKLTKLRYLQLSNNQIEKLGFIKTIKFLNLFSIIWLFFIYPFLLGYSYILANKLYDIIY